MCRSINSAEVFAEIEMLYVQLKRHSLVPTTNVAYLKARLTDLVQTFANTTVDSQSFLWQRMHFESAKQLKINNDVVLTRPDKGAGEVILNKADYLSKMDSNRGDTDRFLKLGDLSFDDTKRTENKLQKRLQELLKKKLISREIYEFIRPVGSQRPRMYGLPKIHKSGIPLRPILSMCHSAQHSLAKWLVDILNHILEFYSVCCIKDSFTFSSIICRLPVWMESQFLISFDVVSHFTNIPLDETISIYADFLYRGPSIASLPFPGAVFIELMDIATKSVSFSFNETMFLQIEGVSMGSPLGSILANIFVGFHERRLFDKFPKPFTYLRYVDDTFVSIKSRSDALEFFDTLNQLHYSLSFTMEGESNGLLPFLDVLVERGDSSFLTSVYRKPTFIGLYLDWHSFAPKSRKLNLIRCLSYRALNICSECKIENELKAIRDIFINNGYPEDVIDNNIKHTVTKFKNMNKVFDPPKCPVYFRLPWVGSATESFANKITSSVYRCYHAVNLRQIFTPRPALNSPNKDKLPIFKQSNLIYKFVCRCNSTYIGMTCQRLEVRVRQHIPRSLLSSRLTSGHSQAMDSAEYLQNWL